MVNLLLAVQQLLLLLDSSGDMCASSAGSLNSLADYLPCHLMLAGAAVPGSQLHYKRSLGREPLHKGISGRAGTRLRLFPAAAQPLPQPPLPARLAAGLAPAREGWGDEGELVDKLLSSFTGPNQGARPSDLSMV